MATRARIGLKLEDGSILSVYHHWDGYPEWLGVTLKERYNTKEKIAELISEIIVATNMKQLSDIQCFEVCGSRSRSLGSWWHYGNS